MTLTKASSLSRPIWRVATTPTIASNQHLSRSLDACITSLLKHHHQPPQAILLLVSGHPHSSKGILSLPSQIHDRLSKVIPPLPSSSSTSSQWRLPPLLGAVVAQVGPTRGPGISIAFVGGDTNLHSVNVFHISKDVGSATREKAVGRWPELGGGTSGKYASASVRSGSVEEREWFDVEKFKSVSMKAFSDDEGRDGRKVVEAVKGLEMGSGDLLVGFSDNDPHSIMGILDRKYPLATKIGLLGSMTPFVTGLPQTLFFNDRVLSEGFLGLSITSKKPGTPIVSEGIQYQYSGLEPLGKPMRITNCRGNVILTFDDVAAAKSVLSAVTGLPKTIAHEKTELYLEIDMGIFTGKRVYRITSGDPSKGTLAVDTLRDLQVGMSVQLLQKTGDYKVKDKTISSIESFSGVEFGVTSEQELDAMMMQELGQQQNMEGDLSVSVSNALRARSEKGWFTGVSDSEVCDVGLANASLRV
ncbi:hypothetical protein HDU76_012881 [Blyttiomyces sp. JEL0837]|nr:hypothetical protein HDU76_012881 [Blyttiomyces sp. JEL0837]